MRRIFLNIRKKSKTSNPWFNKKLKKLKKKKIQAWNKYNQNKTTDNEQNYKIKLNNYTNELRKTKNTYENTLADKVKTDNKLFYKYVKSKTRIREAIAPLRNVHNEIKADNQEKCNILNEHFTSVFNSQNYNISQEGINQNVRDSLQTIDIDRLTIIQKLTNLKPNKSPGIDQIESSFLILMLQRHFHYHCYTYSKNH